MCTSVPITLHGWMKSARSAQSNRAYVKGAVDLAWKLTKRICQTIAASPEVKLQDHISANKIILFVEVLSLAPKDATVRGVHPIVDVKFQFEAREDSIIEQPPTNKEAEENETNSHCPLSVCAALGKLLLEIFSMNRSNSLLYDSGGTSNENHESSDSVWSDYSGPPEKRHAAVSENGSTSAIAKNLLLEMGSPLSLCQLVCDLLDAKNEPRPRTSFSSVKEVFWDLTKMKTQPERFLFDRTHPREALDDTCLFGSADKQLFGRGDEKNALMTSKNKISTYMKNKGSGSTPIQGQGNEFMCETVFLSGYAGSGKSSLLNTLIDNCNEDKWFVLGSKFDKQAAPHVILAKAFDEFFGKWGQADGESSNLDPSMRNAYREVCRIIFTAIDDEGFHQLRGLIPNFAAMFPLLATTANNRDEDGISSMDKVGSAKKRLHSLFNVLIKSICSVGRPVLFAFDDLQWSDSFVLEVIAEFTVNYTHDASGVSGEVCRQGLLVAGAYRNNEVQEDGNLFQGIKSMEESGKANVATLKVGELTEADIIQLISAKLCLPWRHVKELASVVLKKTRGNPFFVVQFLKSIVQNKMLDFSVRERRWVWDSDVVDMQMISDGVAELLTSTFSRLPERMIQAVKVASCLGSQVEASTIEALNLGHQLLPFDIQSELQLAVNEGIMERAGPVYQFTHDIVQHTVYKLIPSDHRGELHRTIGMSLLKSAAKSSAIHLLAVDQINMFCSGGSPSPEERAQFAEYNVMAAKFAMSASSFVQARSYIDVGMQLLQANHWETQYFLSLDLFEMSASVSCIDGDMSKMSSCLDEILSHTRTFDDSLKASSLLVKLLASSSKFDKARSNCLVILANFGEVFPSTFSLPLVLRELSAVQARLANITRDQIKLLPPMKNKDKLNVMKFLNMLCMYSIISKPMLLPLLSCRMVTLTMEYGFCADSIVGFATAGYSIFLFTEDIQLACNIGRVCDSLVEESPMKHVLRSRLCNELVTTLRAAREPWRSLVSSFPDLYNSAMMAGDTENASICRWTYCAAGFWAGALDLSTLSKNIAMCIKEVAKYQQHTMLYSTMGLVHSCCHLSGNIITINDMEIKPYDELSEIGEKTCNAFLLWQTFMCCMSDHFWMREYMEVATLSEKYSEKHPSSLGKRILQVVRSFHEGIAYLNLARDTRMVKWRILAEKEVVTMKQFEATMSKYNLENKCMLLEAELHYLDGDLEAAEASYKASVESAHKNMFIHEEALAYELYGIFCVEGRRFSRGSILLHSALETYKRWGAMNKVNELQLFIDRVDASYIKS